MPAAIQQKNCPLNLKFHKSQDNKLYYSNKLLLKSNQKFAQIWLRTLIYPVTGCDKNYLYESTR
jgi:hypothetical protein